MQFIYYAQTPANTSSKNPHITTCTLSYGYITSLLIVFPKGCSGLVGLQIWKQTEQFFPWNMNAWLIGDDLKENFEQAVPMTDEITQVQLVTYNNDTLYSHTPYVVFTVGPLPSSPGGSTGTSSGEYISGDQSALPTPTPTPGPTPVPSVKCPDGSYAPTLADCPKKPTPPPGPAPPAPHKYTKSELAALGVIL